MHSFIRPLFLFLFASLFFQSLQSQAPQVDYIAGKITDAETGEELIGAEVLFYDADDRFITRTSTDFYGNYKVKINEGNADWIEAQYLGYITQRITDVGEIKKIDISMKESMLLLCIGCPFYQTPLIDLENTTSGQIFTSEEIRNSPIKDIREITSSVPGVSFNNW